MVWSEPGRAGSFLHSADRASEHPVHAALLVRAMQLFLPGMHSSPFLYLSPFVLSGEGGFD